MRKDEAIRVWMVLMTATCWAFALVGIAVEEHPMTLHTEFPIALSFRSGRDIVRKDEVISNGFVTAACCTLSFIGIAVEEQRVTLPTIPPVGLP
ncbi:hypothetical protein CPJCM30710_10320 [Clostridium polyendosporum]|uniref:Uncharacterized protein n=1 Tax=Clostridium polyendosporum TaxID=69208 RepID=A0A919VG90_9CLOT|nr:hypothetical protein CPJCM30710_10320 [Clostridium polyendosporum]